MTLFRRLAATRRRARALAPVWTVLLLAWTSTTFAQQPTRNGASVGYIYPAGACQGATTRAVVGGQVLDGVSRAYISGSGVQITVKEHIKPLTMQQVNKLRDTVKELTERRAAALAWPKLAPASRPTTRPVFTQEDAKVLEEVRDKLATSVSRPAFPAISEIVVLEVTVAKDASPGRREVRFQTTAGLTNPLVFYVGQLPEVSEVAAKPRAQATASVPGQQMTVKLPVMINGQILPGGVNRYLFQASKGQSLVAAACARGLTPYLADAVPGWFQATLTLYDATGRELAADDDSRVDHDPLLHFVIPADGQYVIEIKDALFRGREDFVYRLTLGDLPCPLIAFPLGGAAWAHAADDLPECLAAKPNKDKKDQAAQAVNLPIMINGRIATPGDCGVFSFAGKAGEQIVAEVTACRLGSPLDSVLDLTDAAGKQLAYNDDFDDPAAGLITHQADSYLTVTLPADGTYFLHLRDVQGHGGPDYAYRLRISHPRPDFQVLSETSSINMRAGESATINVRAIRRDGFSGPINLALTGDTSGFKLTSAVIPAQKDKAQIKLLAPSKATGQAVSLHLEGQANIDGQQVTHALVPADNSMQAFAYWHLVPAEDLMVMVLAPVVKPVPIAADSVRLGANITAKFVAEQLSLTGETSEKFVTAYVNQRLASFQHLRETLPGATGKQTATAIADASKTMQGVLEANLGAAQATKASALLGPMFGVLERDVASLLDVNVTQAKVQQAMPVLSRYVQNAKVQVYDQVAIGVLARPDGVAKIHDLRLAAAKELAPIVGTEAANKWAEQPAMAMQIK